MIKVYVAGALNAMAVDYIKNLSRMIMYDRILRTNGFATFNPGLDFIAGIYAGDMEYKDYADNNMAFVTACDAMFVCPHSEKSKGVKAEIATAREAGIPIFYTIDEIVDWKKLVDNMETDDILSDSLSGALATDTAPDAIHEQYLMDLLERLWGKYSDLITEITKHCTCGGRDILLTDSAIMRQLRQDLFNVGVRGIAGFKYGDNKNRVG